MYWRKLALERLYVGYSYPEESCDGVDFLALQDCDPPLKIVAGHFFTTFSNTNFYASVEINSQSIVLLDNQVILVHLLPEKLVKPIGALLVVMSVFAA